MRVGVQRVVFTAAASLLWLSGCETTSIKLPDLFGAKSDTAETAAADPATTGSVNHAPPPADAGSAVEPIPPLTPSSPNDDMSLAKMNFRQGNYGLAQRYFQRAVETGPREAEAWLGLAASYDRLRRFDLADRAYAQLIRITGPTPGVLNNQGYSYMLRGDFKRARAILLEAQAKDLGNPYIHNNLDLLEESVRTRRAVR
jgi:Flp pilus assembly protein TadD